MKNVYSTTQDTATIELKTYDGVPRVTVIDLADLDLAQSHNGTWYAGAARKSKTKFYVFGKHWDTETHKKSTISLHRLLMSFPARDVNHIDNDGLNNRRSNLETLDHRDNVRWRWPDRDWTDYDLSEAIAVEYRQERDIAASIAAEFNLSRQQLWKIRKGTSRRSPAAKSYNLQTTKAKIRTLEELMLAYPRDGKWGAWS